MPSLVAGGLHIETKRNWGNQTFGISIDTDPVRWVPIVNSTKGQSAADRLATFIPYLNVAPRVLWAKSKRYGAGTTSRHLNSLPGIRVVCSEEPPKGISVSITLFKSMNCVIPWWHVMNYKAAI